MKTLLALILAGLSARCAVASEPSRDLGQGLYYCRIHQLPADLPSADTLKPGPCVLDLRYAKADETAAAALKAWVRFNLSAHAPLLILENAETATALKSALSGGEKPGLLVLAPASANLAPDIAVNVPPETDRNAYDALEKGAALDTLLTDYPDTPRIDEAYLEKEHISDSDAPEVPADKSLRNPLVDRLLQRAVQIHRGLKALKRI